mmetsp:Transcript_138868/g.352013  ORF Transcript_138868/g.352013 Transcript_138868/m.352013 type:complete len:217 (+) Transcript_138868:1254-1904(+)
MAIDAAAAAAAAVDLPPLEAGCGNGLAIASKGAAVGCRTHLVGAHRSSSGLVVAGFVVAGRVVVRRLVVAGLVVAQLAVVHVVLLIVGVLLPRAIVHVGDHAQTLAQRQALPHAVREVLRGDAVHMPGVLALGILRGHEAEHAGAEHHARRDLQDDRRHACQFGDLRRRPPGAQEAHDGQDSQIAAGAPHRGEVCAACRRLTSRAKLEAGRCRRRR